MNRSVTLLICLFFNTVVFSQTYHFLNIPTSIEAHAKGRIAMSSKTDDVGVTFQNPASLKNKNHSLSASYQFLFNSVRTGHFGYAQSFKNTQLFTGIQFMSYGSLQGADELGNRTTEFQASEYAFLLGSSRALSEKLTIGANIKYIYSRLESYTATALGIDLGMYFSFNDKTSLALSFNNWGTTLKAYDNKRFLLPYDIRLGLSQELKYLPFRYSIHAHNLYRWKLRTIEPKEEISNIDGEMSSPSKISVFADNLFRHLIFSGELHPRKGSLKIMLGYNHQLRKEMQVTGLRSFHGFSGGIMFKVRKFSAGFSVGLMHLHGSSQRISLTYDLSTK